MADILQPLNDTPSFSQFSLQDEEEVETLEHLGYKLLKENTELTLLVEIIGLTDLKDSNERRKQKQKSNKEQYKSLRHLPASATPSPSPADKKTKKTNKYCNTHCTISYNNKIIHKTATIKNDNNPIYDINKKSIFLLKSSANDIITSNGIKISVHDEVTDAPMNISLPSLNKLYSELIGEVLITPIDILKNCNESRLEYKLAIFNNKDNDKVFSRQPQEQQKQSVSNGNLAIRFRIATNHDIEFMNKLNKNEIKPPKLSPHLISDKTIPSFTNQMKSLRNVLNPNNINESLNRKIRIKPGPDPKCKHTTTYMTKDDIKNTFMLPSTNWIETGSTKCKSKSLGRIYLEILQCNDIPNMDVGGAIGNLTDSFVCAIHEDTMLETDVINDELDPIWMPWTRRAFIFNILHPLSSLYIAVFDHDLGVMGHEGIGRIVLNMNNFYNNIEYVLTYKLYSNDILLERKDEALGSITIRLRLEIDNEQKYLLTSYKIPDPPKFHVNVTNETSLSVIRYTIHGKYGTNDTFDLDVIKSYVWEFFYYKDMISYYISDSLHSLIFWKGDQVELFYGWKLPMHSAIAFIIATNLVENMHLVLPTFFFFIAWIMISTRITRNKHPSPWYKSKSTMHYLKILSGANPNSKPEKRNIGYCENAKDAQEYDKAWTKRLEEDLEKSNKAYEVQLELDNIANEVIETKINGNKFDIYNQLAPIALRMQQRLSGYCHSCRTIKSILNWDESILSFWITIYTLSIGIVLLIIPWAWILHWILRIVVWTFLGPWMMIVDKYLMNKGSDHETALAKHFHEQSKVARLKGEENIKRKALRSLLYGDYSVNVPHRNVSLHYDVPLSESTGTATKKTKQDNDHDSSSTNYYVPGQYLDGNMILRRYYNEQEIIDEELQLEQSNFELLALQQCANTLNNNKVKDKITKSFISKNNPYQYKKKIMNDVIDEELIYDDSIEVSYDDMVQHEEASEEVMPRSNDNASLSSSEITISTNNGANNNYKSINEKQQYHNHNHRYNDELISTTTENTIKKQSNNDVDNDYVIQSVPSWRTTCSHNSNYSTVSSYHTVYHDARDEDEVEEQGLEIISYHQIDNNDYSSIISNNDCDDVNNDDNVDDDNNSTITTLSSLCSSPASRDVDIAFYKKKDL